MLAGHVCFSIAMKHIITLFLAMLAIASADAEFPPGYQIMEDSASPDGAMAVIEPAERMSDGELEKARNHLVRVDGKAVIGEIEGVAGRKHMNHGGAEAHWSAAGDRLLWIVEGKWSPRTVTMIEIKDGGIARQSDLIKAGYAEILKLSKAAHPKTYAAAVKANNGNGAAFPDGFTVSLMLKDNNAKLPARFLVSMTADPKARDGFPDAAWLDAFLFGTLTEQMRIEWGDFGAYDARSSERLAAELEGAEEGLAHQLDAVMQKLSKKERAELEAEQALWEKSITEIDEDWPVAGSLTTTVSEKLRYDATRRRVKQLADRISPKKG